jgi:hypothetical protein
MVYILVLHIGFSLIGYGSTVTLLGVNAKRKICMDMQQGMPY